ncbi:MAG: hypothetical protein WCA22_00350 [Candidatus Binatus sp.]
MSTIFTQTTQCMAGWLNQWTIKNYEPSGFPLGDDSSATFTVAGNEKTAAQQTATTAVEDDEEAPFGTHIREAVRTVKELISR